MDSELINAENRMGWPYSHKDSMECVETVRQLLLANPEVVRDFMPFNLCR